MPRLLIVSYAYPPLGGIAIIRALTLARKAMDEGWEVAFLAVANDPLYLRDESLSTKAPAVYAYRYPIYLITNRFLRRLLPGKRLLWSFLDSFYDWVPDAVHVGKKLYKKWPYDVIFASAPRFSSLRVARKLKESLNVPAVADLRDSFIYNFAIDYIHPWIRRFWHIYYHNLLSKFDKITAVDYNAIRGINLPHEIIYNGFDEEEFSGDIQKFETFTIGHIGTIYPQYRIESLIKGILKIPLELRNRMRVLFVGDNTDVIRKMKNKMNLDFIEVRSRVPRDEAIEIMRRCHVLLVLSGAVTDALGAKIFECARTGATVLNFAKPGSIPWKFAEETGLAHNVAFDRPREIAKAIVHASKRESFDPPKNIQQYSRDAASEQLLDILSDLVKSSRH
ncbi:MAG: hypothetical protein GF411_16320 [Candidatus Lokiarchaeota archaeon]|nr:hypothetical protein [Candidatus Lokiarchaeota archaeon]